MQTNRKQAVEENTESALGLLEEAITHRCDTFPGEDYDMYAYDWYDTVDYAMEHHDGTPTSLEMKDLVLRLRELLSSLRGEALNRLAEEGEAGTAAAAAAA